MTPDTTSVAPSRTNEQRLDALTRANDVRSRRARLKKDLKAGRRSMYALLLDPPEWLLTAKVYDLLLHVPKYGRVKVNKIFKQCQISPSKTFGGLSARQRNEITRLIRCRDDEYTRYLAGEATRARAYARDYERRMRRGLAA